jgi:hypothetical protein
MGRVCGSCFDINRSSQSASIRVRSETELSLETKVRTVRRLFSILVWREVRWGGVWREKEKEKKRVGED